MTRFISTEPADATEVQNNHGGSGPILFQRLMRANEFESEIDFVDYSIIPPGSSIGKHDHHGNEELYFVSAGNPLMRVAGEERRLQRGAVSVVRDGEWHELINDTDSDVEILVVQVSVR